MKCNVCNERISENDKFCSNCGQPIGKHEEPVSSEENVWDAGKVAFLTCGDVFIVGGELNVLGISVQSLRVKDVLVFDNEKLTINEIKVMGFGGTKKVKEVEKGKNCVLSFGKKIKLSKESINYYCEKNSANNYPINFNTQPTTAYTAFLFDK